MDTNTGINQETQQTEERTFTQAELNAIVQERIGETKAKYEDYEALKAKASKYDEQIEAGKSELQKATERAERLQAELNGIKKAEELRTMREQVSNASGIPAGLLTGNDREECEAQAQAMLTWAQQRIPNGYPRIPDGGDPIGNAKKSTRELFAEWFNENV